MRKYAEVMKMTIQISLAYKWNLILSSLMDIFRIVAEVAFWKILFETTSGDAISGYDFNSMITYYIFMFIIGTSMNVSNIGNKIANDIKNGTMNNLIIRPINYIGYYFSEALSEKFIQALIVLLTFFPIFIIDSSNITLNINLEQLLLFPIILVLSFLLNFLINIIISLLVFWITEVTSFFFLKDIFLDFLSGRVFPMDLLPKFILNTFGILPFMYCTFFPITILTKGISNESFFKGFFMQLIWLALLYFTFKILWRIGIKKYSGTGA
ncbi:ABC-2 family transporter protein [Clostridium sp. YIM B02505]|uniref:ABC-2 family transporter protein n=1 Tax=Clostridium yunnanense TaxID=2800325 RepID=A0ABS1ETK5_9CLOT|nr:ABC-2 family transporter protein [Clostridium yunnanense]MBK1812726.1 ABC-2 family transporter protein [Clostridium yunnanense]